MINFAACSLGEEVVYYINSNGEPVTKSDSYNVGTERGIVIGKSRHYVMLGFKTPPPKGQNFPIEQFTAIGHRDMKFYSDFDLYPFYVFASICHEVCSIGMRTFRASGPATQYTAVAKTHMDDAAFFGAVAQGNCRCNIPKQSCDYHKD